MKRKKERKRKKRKGKERNKWERKGRKEKKVERKKENKEKRINGTRKKERKEEEEKEEERKKINREEIQETVSCVRFSATIFVDQSFSADVHNISNIPFIDIQVLSNLLSNQSYIFSFNWFNWWGGTFWTADKYTCLELLMVFLPFVLFHFFFCFYAKLRNHKQHLPWTVPTERNFELLQQYCMLQYKNDIQKVRRRKLQ